MAERLAANGARVAIGFRRDAAAARSVLERIEGFGGEAVLAQSDLAEERPTRRMLERVVSELGPIDVLVHGAWPGWKGGRADRAEWADFESFFQGMVGTLHRLLRHLVPGMVERRAGSIVILSSTSLYTLNPEHAAYGTAKGALVGLARSLATDLGPHGIRVNLVAPSLVWTGSGAEPEGWGREHRERSALKRLPTVEEIAGAVVFFASPWSSAVTGAHLSPGGGLIYLLG